MRNNEKKLQLEFDKFNFEKNKYKIEILLKEYQNRFSEIVFHSGRYHKQVDFLQVYLTVLGSLLAVIFTTDWNKISKSMVNFDIQIIYSAILFLAYVILVYLFTNVMDSLYLIYMNGRRISAIETKINTILGDTLLTWDSNIIPKLFGTHQVFIGFWIRPNLILGIWSFLFIFGVTFGICIISYYIANSFFYIFTPIALFISSFLIFNWILLHSDGLGFIDWAVNGKKFEVSNWSISIGIILMNIFLFYLPMMLFSIRDNSFFFGVYDFPFLSLTSVFIGDLIFLPIFDIYAIKWLYAVNKILKINFIIHCSSAFLALSISILIHIIWINDQWTGFMDIVFGKLSVSGWIHLVYTAIQLYLMIIFIFEFIKSVKNKSSSLLDKNLLIALIFILIFSFLSIVDWYIRNIVIFKQSLIYSLKIDFFSMSTFFISLIFILILSKKR